MVSRHVWILTWLPLVLPAAIGLPKPINVTVTPTRWGYVLRWDPGPGTPTGTSYNVSTQTDRSNKDSVTGCQHVQNPLTCNLTEVLKLPWEKYDFTVQAHLEAQSSQPAEVQYKPLDHLDLPLLTAAPCHRGLCVDLQPPQQYPPQFYNGLDYQLQIRAGDTRAQTFKNFRSLEPQVLVDLLPGREYCISVRFLNSLDNKKSNFSRPVCVSAPGSFSADPLIAATLSLLTLMVLVAVVLLGWSGFLCPIKSPMPPILTSIHHLEEVLVQASSSSSSSSLIHVWLVAPPAGEKTSGPSSSEDSDEDVSTSCMSSSGVGGGGYTERVGTNLYSSSSSSSSSLSSQRRAETRSCSRTPDGFHPQPQSITGTQNRTEPNAPSSQSLTQGGAEEDHQEVEGAVGQDVNLLTLTFGMQEEDQEEEDSFEPSEESSVPQVPQVPQVLPSQPAASLWTLGDEEETDETCGYMVRPSADVLQNLLPDT